jgi:hypothetical protein
MPGYVYLGDTHNGFGMFRDTGRYADGAAWTPRRREGSDQASASVNSTNGISGNGVHGTNKKKAKSVPGIDWPAYLKENQANAREVLLLADILGVNPDALRRLQMGYVPETEGEPEHWLFAERDGEGRIIGLLRRYGNGEKRRMAGGRCGLIFEPSNSLSEAIMSMNVLLAVEGPSDVAAALTMDLPAVGRPNNMGGAELLASLIRQKVTDGVVDDAFDVVVLGENDLKTSGKAKDLWPGRDGAVHVATLLSRSTGRRIAWCMPPEGVKDFREWLWQGGNVNIKDKERCQKMGRDVLTWIRANLQWIELPDSVQTSRNVPDSTILNTVQCNLGHSSTFVHDSGTDQTSTESSRSSSSSAYLEWEKLGPFTQDVIALGTKGRPCPRHCVPLLQGRGNPRLGLTFRVDCRTYTCPACGPRRRCKWLSHLMNIFDLQATLCVAVVPADRLDALRKYVHRQEADYVALTMTESRLTFIASCYFPDPELVTRIDAAEFAATALQNLDTSKLKPISTSRDWAMHEVRVEADYLRRGAAPIGRFNLVVFRLRRAQLDPFVQPDDRGARADWLFPGDWHDAQIEWFYDGLASPPGAGEANGEEEDRS